MSGAMRSRWAAVGAAVAVTLGAGGVAFVANAAGGTPTSFIPIVPCRLMDTRPAPNTVGPRATPIGPDESYAVAVRGASGECNIPSQAVAVSLNVTAVGPTAGGFLTVYPSDASVPNASNLNFRAAQGATPNAVTSALSPDGRVSFFNKNGSVNVIADIVGYFEPSSSGPAGPTGPAGPAGSTGPTGPQGPAGAHGTAAPHPAEIIWVAPTAGEADATTVTAALAMITDNSVTRPYLVKIAPGTYIEPGAITLKNYVDIEGSGVGVTTITCSCGADAPYDGLGNYTGASAFVRAVGLTLHSEVRSLTIENTDAGVRDEVVGVWLQGVTNVSLSDVEVRVDGAALDQRAIDIDGGAPSLTKVDVVASGVGAAAGGHTIGINTLESSAVLRDVDVAVTGGDDGFSYGISNSAGSVAMRGVRVDATSGLGASSNTGIKDAGGTMQDVVVNATGGLSGNVGIDIIDSQVRDARIAAEATTGLNVGVVDSGGLSHLDSVTARALGGDDAIGLWNTNGVALNVDPTTWISNSDIAAIGGTLTSIGIVNDDGTVPVVRGSTISGDTTSVQNITGGFALISASGLDGPVDGIGFTCRGVVVASTLAELDAGCLVI
jgi:hypothetical protein